jgi:hypothetical protein
MLVVGTLYSVVRVCIVAIRVNMSYGGRGRNKPSRGTGFPGGGVGHAGGRNTFCPRG